MGLAAAHCETRLRLRIAAIYAKGKFPKYRFRWTTHDEIKTWFRPFCFLTSTYKTQYPEIPGLTLPLNWLLTPRWKWFYATGHLASRIDITTHWAVSTQVPTQLSQGVSTLTFANNAGASCDLGDWGPPMTQPGLTFQTWSPHFPTPMWVRTGAISHRYFQQDALTAPVRDLFFQTLFSTLPRFGSRSVQSQGYIEKVEKGHRTSYLWNGAVGEVVFTVVFVQLLRLMQLCNKSLWR